VGGGEYKKSLYKQMQAYITKC